MSIGPVEVIGSRVSGIKYVEVVVGRRRTEA